MIACQIEVKLIIGYSWRICLKKIFRSYLFLGLVSGLIIALDQYTKWVVRQNLALGESWMPLDWLSPYARILHWYNTGVAFGLFQNGNTIFAILATLVSLAIIYYFSKVPAEDWTLRLAMGLQLGGALGNLIDRIVIGHVTDFISVGTFPVLNIADASITVGVAVLVLGVWMQEKRDKKARLLAEEQDGSVGDTQKPAAIVDFHE